MEIKECKSQDLIMKEIKQKLIEIANEIKSNYTNELGIYRFNYSEDTYHLAEVVDKYTTLFGVSIFKSKHKKDILTVSFINRKLIVVNIDPSEFLYPIVKEEFTKFAEINKNNIKSLCFVKDFNLENL